MRKIKLTQGKYALVDDADFDWLAQWKWQYDKKLQHAVRNTYIKGSGKQGQKNDCHVMARDIMDCPADMVVDHINHNRTDNQRENLRICTKQQNSFNKQQRAKSNTSGFKGVSWNKNAAKWMAKINANNVQIYLGIYSDIREAIEAYNQAATKYHGRFAKHNDV